MLRRALYALALAALTAVALASPALAQSEGTLRVRLDPNLAGAGSRLLVEASGQEFQSGGALPRSVVIATARGFRFDPRAVAGRCTDQQARAFTCPANSRIGGGQAEGSASGPLVPGGSQNFTATIDLFLAPARRGEVAGVVVQITLGGFRATARGSFVSVSSRRYGAELRFDFPDQQPVPPGVTLSVRRVTLTVGAARRVNGVRRTLIRNPATCRGSWPYQVRVGFSDRTVVRNGSAPCRARRASATQPSFTG